MLVKSTNLTNKTSVVAVYSQRISSQIIEYISINIETLVRHIIADD